MSFWKLVSNIRLVHIKFCSFVRRRFLSEPNNFVRTQLLVLIKVYRTSKNIKSKINETYNIRTDIKKFKLNESYNISKDIKKSKINETHNIVWYILESLLANPQEDLTYISITFVLIRVICLNKIRIYYIKRCNMSEDNSFNRWKAANLLMYVAGCNNTSKVFYFSWQKLNRNRVSYNVQEIGARAYMYSV